MRRVLWGYMVEEFIDKREYTLAEVMHMMREDRRQEAAVMKEFDERLRRVEQKLGLA